ncbi:hypothetical protein [Streptosporangium sp. NBC_01469]|uniref:hypothetical protein n=1 Tax=Streptosporangium sp. NBC_01469 TaxID=2903898 RepID=UPI002E2E6E79|nr:hypothetical protein [Streptosporangium sp. NBC_01469]
MGRRDERPLLDRTRRPRGEWNGRSLTDNAPDVMFSFATNTAFTIGLTGDSVAVKPTRAFPYVPSAA